MKKIMTAAAVMVLLSGCGQIDGYDISVYDSDSGTFAVLQTADTTATVAHTTRNIPETETSTAAISTAETAENTEISAETEPAYTEPETEYFNEIPEEKTEPFTPSETAVNESATETRITATEKTITPAAVTTKVTKPVQANISWTAARVEYSAEGWQGAEFVLSAEDTKIIKDYCFGSKYELGTCDCLGDYVFTTENGAQIYYHSDCGVFNDFANERSYKALDWMRDEINEILSKY